MEFTLPKDVFQKALQKAQSAIDAKPVVPLLSCVKINAANGKVSFTATNLDMEASEEVAAEVKSEGEVAIPITFLTDLVKKMPSNSNIKLITHEAKEADKDKDDSPRKVTLVANKIKIDLGALSANKFPKSLAEATYDVEFELDAKEVYEMIRKTHFSISTDYEKITLNSFLLHTVQNEEGKVDLCGVTTDGRRLSFSKITMKDSLPIFNKIIPRRGINELFKLVNGNNGKVKFRLSENRASFIIDSLHYTTKLSEGKFPEYKKVVPLSNTKILSVNTKALLEALERVFIIYRVDNLKGVKLSIVNNLLTLSAHNNNGDMAEEMIEVEFSEQEKFETLYDPKFILEALNHIDSDKVRFSFSDPVSPLLATTPGDDSFYYVIMPIRP